MARLTPIDYRMDVLNPMQMAMSGYQAGFGQMQQLDDVRRQREADRMAAEVHDMQMGQLEQAQAQAMAMQQEQADFLRGFSERTHTPETLRRFRLSSNELIREMAGEELKNLEESARSAQFNSHAGMANAFINDPEIGLTMLEEERDAYANAGDMEQVKVHNGLIQIARSDPNAGASIAYQLAMQTGTEEEMENLESMLAMGQQPELDPTTLQRDSINYADLQGYERGTPEHNRAQLEYINAKKESGGVKITLAEAGPTKETLGPMQIKMDEAYSKMLVDWNITGGADVVKSLDQLNEVADRIESGDENLSGWIVGNVPELVLGIANPAAMDAQDLVSEIVQRNLKAVLGAQFTEKEGQALIARAYNKKLPEEMNARRLRRLIQSIDTRARALESLNKHFDTYGTAKGWSGQLSSIQTMLQENEAADRAGAGPREGQKIKIWNPETMRMEEVE